jgi:hypothetical protein
MSERLAVADSVLMCRATTSLYVAWRKIDCRSKPSSRYKFIEFVGLWYKLACGTNWLVVQMRVLLAVMLVRYHCSPALRMPGFSMM